MWKKINERLKASTAGKIIKFILIFSVTGSSCLFVSDRIAFYLESLAGVRQHIILDVILVTVTYQYSCYFSAFCLESLDTLLISIKRLKMLLFKDT